MARVVGPLHSVSAAGSVGGVQFSQNRSGSHCGRKSTSTRAQNERAILYRSKMPLAQHAWRDLAPVIQAQWNSLATPTQSGRNLYIGSALRCLMAGFNTPSQAPAPPPTRGDLTGLRYVPRSPYTGIGDLLFSPDSPWNDYLLIYTASNVRDTMPHVRKFRFYKKIMLDWLGDPIQAALFTPRFAMRILLFRPSSGYIFREWRGIIDGDTAHTFADYTP